MLHSFLRVKMLFGEGGGCCGKANSLIERSTDIKVKVKGA